MTTADDDDVMRRDFKRQIYKQCDEEDAKEAEESMTTEEILAAATPRPWKLEDLRKACELAIAGKATQMKETDGALIILAVNSYERAQRIIKALSEELRQSTIMLRALRAILEDKDNRVEVKNQVVLNDAALALAKEAL